MMASENTGKIRTKRARNNKPYSRDQSFIGKIKSAIPSWFKKVLPWQNEDKSELPSCSTSSSEFKQPHTIPLNVFSPVVPLLSSVAGTSSSEELLDLTRSHFSSYQPLNSNNNLDDVDDGDSVSTSGCSSMVPHLDQNSQYQQDVLPVDEPVLEQFRDKLQNDTNILRSNKSTRNQSLNQGSGNNPALFSNHNRSANFDVSGSADPQNVGNCSIWSQCDQSLETSHNLSNYSNKKPSFNISAFGSPLFANKFKGSILSETANESIYYPGKTAFGGASAQRKVRPNSFGPYHKNISRPQVRLRQKDNEDLGLVSNTAKKIFRTLETMSTPLSDAQKIPSNSTKRTSSILSFTSPRSKISKPSSRRPDFKQGPPVKRILPPEKTIPHTIKLIDSIKPAPISSKIVDNVQKVQDAAKPQAAPALSSAGGKMKSRTKESLHYSVKGNQDIEENEIPLPSMPKVSLNMKTLPQFDFGSSLCADSHSTPMPSAAKKAVEKMSFSFMSPVTTVPSINKDQAVESHNFTFSSPVVTNVSTNKSTAENITKEFTFAAPLISSDHLKTSDNKVNTKKKESTNLPKTDIKSTTSFKVPDQTLSKTKLPTFDQGAGEAKGGSLNMKKTVFSSDKQVSVKSQTSGFGLQFKAAPGSWECEACMISNKSDADACVACQTTKPKSKEVVSSSSAIVKSVFDQKFTTPSNVWECPTCMIQNKNDVGKCAACETAKPGATPVKPVSAKGFGNLFQATDTWECPMCMIQNKKESEKCVACEAKKPGSAQTTAAPVNTANFGFGDKFKSNKTWECDTCLIQNKMDASKCVACETPRADQPHPIKGTFVFGAASTKPTFGVSSEEGLPKSDSGFKVSQSTFTFGAPVNTQSKDTGFKITTGDSGFKVAGANAFTGGFQFAATEKTSVKESSKNQEGAPKSSFPAVGGFAPKLSTPSVIPNANDKLENKKTDAKENTVTINFGQAKDAKENQEDKSFVFGSKTSEKPAGGFTFGSDAIKATALPASEIKLSFESSDKPKPAVSAAPMFTASVPSTKTTGSFSFDTSSKTEVTPATNILPKTTSSSSSGFQFNPKSDTTTIASSTSSATSLFSFEKPASTSDSSAPMAVPARLFAFGKPTGTTTATADSSKPFKFGAPTSTSSSAGFAFTSNTPAVSTTATTQFSFMASNPAASSNKEPASNPTSLGFQQPKLAGNENNAGFKNPVGSFGSFQAPSKPNTTSTFVFGKPAVSTSSASSGTTSGFTFGAQPTNVSGAGSASSTPFVFGTQSNSTDQPKNSSSAFVFGAQNSANPGPPNAFPSSNFSFGSTQPTAETPSSNFAFGSQAPSQAGAPEAAPPAFGQPIPPTFSFGAPQTQPSGFPPAANPVFQFGNGAQPNPAAGQTNMMASNQPPAAGGFNFNTSTPANTNFNAAAPAQPFQFSATGGDNPFNVTAPQQKPPPAGRKFKRAQRRLPK